MGSDDWQHPTQHLVSESASLCRRALISSLAAASLLSMLLHTRKHPSMLLFSYWTQLNIVDA